MLGSEHFNRTARIAAVLAVLFATVLWLAPSKLGVSQAERHTSYEELFEEGHVMDIQITADADAWQDMLDNASNEEYISCDVSVDGNLVANAAIRPKGNTSLSQVVSSDSDRYSFKIEFDHYQSGQSLLGLDKLVLNNTFADATYLKEYIGYEIFNTVGVVTPLHAFANITVNGEPWGLYLALEAMEDSFAYRAYGYSETQLYKPETMGGGQGGAPNGSGGQPEGFGPQNGGEQPGFDSEPPEGFDPQNGGGRGGFPGGGSSGGGSLVYIDDEPESYSTIFESAVFDLSEQDQTDMIRSLKVLAGEDYDEIEKYIDVDACLRYLAGQSFIINFDSYFGSMQHNYYLRESAGKLTMLPWDLNLAFGGFESSDATSSVNYPIDTPLSGSIAMEDRPLVGTLLNNPEYLERYHGYLQQICDDYINSGVFTAQISLYSDLLAPYVEADATAFYTLEQFKTGVKTLKTFVLLRSESVQKQIQGEIPASSDARSDSDVLVDASSINLKDMGTQGNDGAGGKGDIDGEMGDFHERRPGPGGPGGAPGGPGNGGGPGGGPNGGSGGGPEGMNMELSDTTAKAGGLDVRLASGILLLTAFLFVLFFRRKHYVSTF